MKTKKTFFITCILLFYFHSFGFSNDLQLGMYFTNKYPIADMTKLSVSNIGTGISFEYTMPFFNYLGVNASSDIESVISKKQTLKNWWDISLSTGIYGNFYFGKKINFRPSISYGAILHILDIETESKLFVDQIIQCSLSFRFIPNFLGRKGFSFGIAPTYTLATEKDIPLHYLGFRTGFHYKF